ncbi:MAG: fimbria major subunit, partial [Muribaculaceae bacterium]|nr:fimbria major subunit [Muribaculaceae bacterium]
SNSVFFTTGDRRIAPTEDDKYILVPISEKENVYKSVSELDNGKKPVEVYVERISAKVTVTLGKDWATSYKVSTEGEGSSTITIFNSADATTKTIKVKPVILGADLNVLTNKASLIKNITYSPFESGYEYGKAPEGRPSYEKFLWNDPLNMRSYWAETPVLVGMTYRSFNNVKGKNMEKGEFKPFTAYINPNTQDYTPGNEDNSLNTKLMVIAQLRGVEVDANGNEIGTDTILDLVRFGGEYMLKDQALAHAANVINVAVRNIDWESKENLSAAEKIILSTYVNNSFVPGLSGTLLEIKANKKSDYDVYTAVINFKDAENYGYTLQKDTVLNDYEDEAVQAIIKDKNQLDATFGKAKSVIDEVIKTTLDDLNEKTNIIYWAEGKTYFYTTIKQQGFIGLTGADDNYLNGVVRNHIYNITLESFYGLGTPVIDPGKPIDPERPKEEKPSYITAKINILPWRVVTNSATIH